jgi:hypothetical protein
VDQLSRGELCRGEEEYGTMSFKQIATVLLEAISVPTLVIQGDDDQSHQPQMRL